VQPSRDTVLGGLVVLIGLLTAFILLDVLGTVFFAITVAYAFTPVYRWLRNWGLPAWWASAATTTLVFVGAVAVFLPIVIVLYLRWATLTALIDQLPAHVTVAVADYSVTVAVSDLANYAAAYFQGLAPELAQTVLVLLVKVGLFGLVLFALFIAQGDAHRAALAVVPDGYHDVVAALEKRARSTLYAIYVLQALTGLATFLIALPVFFALGYPAPFSLAVIAGLLQFAPIVGPSILVGGIAVYHLSVGELGAAVLVTVVAGTLVAWLPDLLVRPRFARRTAHLPGSLYFIGFTGGVFSLGPIGIVAGPLVIALFAESVSLLADHRNGPDLEPGRSVGPAGDEPPTDPDGTDTDPTVEAEGTDPARGSDDADPTRGSDDAGSTVTEPGNGDRDRRGAGDSG
jgi:predicted PurR-regulated permease PerM